MKSDSRSEININLFVHSDAYRRAQRQGLDTQWLATLVVLFAPHSRVDGSALEVWRVWQRHWRGLEGCWSGPLQANLWALRICLIVPVLLSVGATVALSLAIWNLIPVSIEVNWLRLLWLGIAVFLSIPWIASALLLITTWLVDRLIRVLVMRVLDLRELPNEVSKPKGQHWYSPRLAPEGGLMFAAILWILGGHLANSGGVINPKGESSLHIRASHLSGLLLEGGMRPIQLSQSQRPDSMDVIVRGSRLRPGFWREGEPGFLSLALAKLDQSSPDLLEIEVPKRFSGDIEIKVASGIRVQRVQLGLISLSAVNNAPIDIDRVIAHELRVLQIDGPVRVFGSQIDRAFVQTVAGSVEFSLHPVEEKTDSWQPQVRIGSQRGSIDLVLFHGFRGAVEVQSIHERVKAPEPYDRIIEGSLVTTRWRTHVEGQGKVDIRSIGGSVKIETQPEGSGLSR